MRIQFTRTTDDGRPVTQRLKPPALDDPVAFDDDGYADVDDDVGELLVAEFESIERARPTCAGLDGECGQRVSEPGAYCHLHGDD